MELKVHFSLWYVALGMGSVRLRVSKEEEHRNKSKNKGHMCAYVHILVDILGPHYMCVKLACRNWNSRVGSQLLTAGR